ncbi:hypothetical protein OHB06_49550 [Streptomyces sp. NBC_01604]|uniref:hypothetical protein n=1 Tax=Streptomyces sp. NBC_01604 TaxID=2975894 RepID=UPI0038685CF9
MREPLSYDIALSATEGKRIAGVVVHRGGVMTVVLGADGTGPSHVDTANLWSSRDATGAGRLGVALTPGLCFDRHLRKEHWYG